MTDDRPTAAHGAGETRCGREPLIETITRFLEHEHASRLGEIRATLEREIDDAGPGAVEGLSRRLMDAGADWTYYPMDPLARRIHRALADPILQQAPVVSGVERLSMAAGHPVVLIANHLSYSDANAIEVLLQKAGCTEICDRLTVVAGPKVYANVRRRFSSLCFGTIRVPQSSTVSSEDAVMNARDVARGARRSIQIAHERLRLGEVLLLFAEGSRSRTARMQPLLPAAARYLEVPGTVAVPAGLTGTERLFPIAEDGVRPVRLNLRIGRPIAVSALEARAAGDRRLMMDCLGLAIAGLLPREYRGVYDEGTFSDDTARRILADLRYPDGHEEG